MSAAHFAASSGFGYVTTRTPPMIGKSRQTVAPKLWKNGSAPKITSLAPRSSMSPNWRVFASRLRWVSATPLGSPLLPLVKSRNASSRSPWRGMPAMRPSSPAGSTFERRNHFTAPRLMSSLSPSSSMTYAGHGNSFSLSRTAPAVIAVPMPALRMDDSSAAVPAVKLRFTGIFPAKSTARFASIAGAPEGRTMPTRFSGTFLRMMSANESAAASRRPRSREVPSWPSTIAISPGFFFSPRRQASAMWP